MAKDSNRPSQPQAGETAVPVGRLAPSPTGLLHLGHARTFLLAWWHVRSRGGRMLLRVDDLDTQRSRRRYADAALRDLEWLGLDWDGEPAFQSQNGEAYAEATERLLAAGQAYACVCSRADVLRAQTAPHAGEREARYPGTCRDRFTGVAAAESRVGRPAGVRFRVPPGEICFHDGIQGLKTSNVECEVGDFLIARRDKSAAYQLAVVVDDAAQGVNEVFRGDDLLPSTARQALLQRSLGLPHPGWYHVPLVVDAGRSRLAKRSDALGLETLRQQGVEARAIVAWAAQSAGLECDRMATAVEVLPTFSLERLPLRMVPAPALDDLNRPRP